MRKNQKQVITSYQKTRSFTHNRFTLFSNVRALYQLLTLRQSEMFQFTPLANRLVLWYSMHMDASLYFHGGTLVLQGVSAQTDLDLPAPFLLVKGKWRCEAYYYQELVPWLHTHDIRINVPRWQRLMLSLHDQREPHAYQMEALTAWEQAGRRGSVVMPTGAGKTFLAVLAIQRVQASTLVIVPTIDILHMWYYRLSQAFQTEIGVYYSGEKLIQPLTITTYSSAGDLIAEQGNAFKFLICDEVHHLPARMWGEAALMAPAPCRLGLTATYPEAHEQTNGRWRVDELIGPLTYSLEIDQLIGQQLAEYRTQRIRVNLTAEE